MTARRARRALDRIVRCQSLEELLACPPAQRADVYEALRHMRHPRGGWRRAAEDVAADRNVTTAYVTDRAMAVLASMHEVRRHDLYALLGVDPSANADDIRRRWRQIAKRHHPDRPDADGELFRHLSAAHAILSDPVQRMRWEEGWRRAQGPLLTEIARAARPDPFPPPRRLRWPGAPSAPVIRTIAAMVVIVALWQGIRQRGEVSMPVSASPTVAISGPPPPIGMTIAPEPEFVAPILLVDEADDPPPANPVVEAAEQVAAPESPPPEILTLAPMIVEPMPPSPEPPPRARRRSSGDAPMMAAATAVDRRIDHGTVRAFLGEFDRRFAAREALGLVEMFTADGIANGRRSLAIAEAYRDLFRRLRDVRYTTVGMQIEPEADGLRVRSEFELTSTGRPTIRGSALWTLVRDAGVVRATRMISSGQDL